MRTVAHELVIHFLLDLPFSLDFLLHILQQGHDLVCECIASGNDQSAGPPVNSKMRQQTTIPHARNNLRIGTQYVPIGPIYTRFLGHLHLRVTKKALPSVEARIRNAWVDENEIP